MVAMTLDEIVEYVTRDRWAVRLMVPVASGTKTKVLESLKQKNVPAFEIPQTVLYSQAAEVIASLPDDPHTVFVVGNLDGAQAGTQRVVLDLLMHLRPVIAVDHPGEKLTELSISIRSRFVHVEVEG